MIITPENLRSGLRHRRRMWPNYVNVFNTEYYDIYHARAKGITKTWWEVTMRRLSRWRANRPHTNKLIYDRGVKQLRQISQQYKKLISAGEPSIIDLQWADIDKLFGIAFAIKPSRSPVFASKMCHFLFPKLFIVMDRKATGIGHYEFYWRGLKNAWNEFEQKEQAQDILFNAIQEGGNSSLHPDYPIETTIMEICTIGYNGLNNV